MGKTLPGTDIRQIAPGVVGNAPAALGQHSLHLGGGHSLEHMVQQDLQKVIENKERNWEENLQPDGHRLEAVEEGLEEGRQTVGD